MNKVRILVDSCADLTKELYKEHEIDVVAQNVRFGEETYLDNGEEITLEQLYEKVKEKGSLPQTSAVTPGAFDEYFKKTLDAGYDIVYVGLGSKLSTTFQNANLAKQSYPEDRIFLVDSGSLSSGIGLVALKACKYRDEGRSCRSCVRTRSRFPRGIRRSALRVRFGWIPCLPCAGCRCLFRRSRGRT